MKILITGGSGQVAFDLVRQASTQDYLFFAPPHAQLDITELPAIRKAFQLFRPDIVINTAAYTRVDQAELERKVALAVNYEGTKNLALACAEFQCPLLHLSTDYVFDGKKQSPYTEDDLPSPINVYGATKWQGEQMVRQYCEKHIILRVSAVFGIHGNNFVKTILSMAKARPFLKVVNDQWTCPTPAADIATALLKLLHARDWGTYHYCGQPVVTWYEFAKKALTLANLNEVEIEPILTADYPTAAARPVYSVLNCQRIEKNFSLMKPHWEKGLHHVIQHLSTA